MDKPCFWLICKQRANNKGLRSHPHVDVCNQPVEFVFDTLSCKIIIKLVNWNQIGRVSSWHLLVCWALGIQAVQFGAPPPLDNLDSINKTNRFPYRMKIYKGFNLGTWFSMVKFTYLNITEIWCLNFKYISYHWEIPKGIITSMY